eukprot:4579630-Pyramimonas_sp.AAC.1
MQCLRRGLRRAEFLEKVEARLQETEDTWRAMLTDGRPDDIFLHLDDVLVTLGQQMFGHVASNDPAYRRAAAERTELLKDRARLRRSRQDMDEDSAELHECEEQLE